MIPNFLFIKCSLLCILSDILNIFLVYFKATPSPSTLSCHTQYCHCATHYDNIQSCFTFQISAFYASRIYDILKPDRDILTLR